MSSTTTAIATNNSPLVWLPAEVRINHCPDGGLLSSANNKAWMEHLTHYILALLGESPEVRLSSYLQAGAQMIAVDVFSHYRDEFVAIKICLDGNTIALSAPEDHQFELRLPGVVDAMAFVSELVSLLQGEGSGNCELWVCSRPQTGNSPIVQH